MALKAKRRTKTVSTPARNGSGNGFHTLPWMPGNPIENHPLAGVIGSHKDDPDWDEFIQIMKDLRREELERDLESLKDQP